MTNNYFKKCTVYFLHLLIQIRVRKILSPLPGFEPKTSLVPSRCSTNLAIQAWMNWHNWNKRNQPRKQTMLQIFVINNFKMTVSTQLMTIGIIWSYKLYCTAQVFFMWTAHSGPSFFDHLKSIFLIFQFNNVNIKQYC